MSGSADNTLKLWDVGTGAWLMTWEGHSATVRRRSVRVFGALTLDYICLFLWGDFVSWLCGRGRRRPAVLVVSMVETSRHFWERKKTRPCFFPTLLPLVRSVAVLPAGDRVVSGSADNTLKLWDVGTGACLMT